MTSPLLEGGVGGADLTRGLARRQESISFSNGCHVSRNPRTEKASSSEPVAFGPSKIFLLASPRHANSGEGVVTSQRGSFRTMSI